MHVEFAEVRKIPIATVLKFYKVYARRRSDSELVADCPFPSHRSSEHKNKNPTLAISIEKNRWFCHSDSCRAASNKPKGGDVIDVVAMMENLTPLEAAKKLVEMCPLFQDASNREVRNNVDATNASNPPLAFELKNLDPTHSFIAERGITLATAKEFGIGFHGGKGSMSNRICFPIYEDGNLVAYCGRTVLPVSDSNPKWKLPSGLQRTFVYGIEKCNPAYPLVLCESPWGCLWMTQHGRQAAALVGCTMTPEQEMRLRSFKIIQLAFDNDAAGREATDKIAERLNKNHKVLKSYLKG